ncbi:MAG: response regulator [Rubrivivax sp.]|nr:response regulator [Rubrivivax sp.]MCL4696320.1 response regulator [Burkholderiaceae bacterium]
MPEFEITPPTPARRPVVLFCDDAPTMRLLLRNILREGGYDGLEADSGPAALQVLASMQPVDLLLTDLHMPGLDGLGVVRQARALAHRRYLPIVMLTTESTPQRVREGAEAGLTAWMVKPFTGPSLLGVLAKALGRRAGAMSQRNVDRGSIRASVASS